MSCLKPFGMIQGDHNNQVSFIWSQKRSRVHLMLGPLLKSSCLKQHWESNQQWKLHIFARAWCCFPAKNNINLHFVYTASHTGCQQVFCLVPESLHFITPVHTLHFTRNYFLFFFLPYLNKKDFPSKPLAALLCVSV